MDETPEMIREQMAETKSQLSDKMESLELQVSETVHSTGTAVNATVAAVQETVETVTGAVQNVVSSVGNALDVRRQIDRHPWLMLGGSVVLGYLAAEYLAGPVKRPLPRPEAIRPRRSSEIPPEYETGEPTLDSGSRANTSADRVSTKGTFWDQLKGVASGALLGISQEVVARAVPLVMNYLTSERPRASNSPSENRDEQGGVPSQPESSESTQRRFIVSAEHDGVGNDLWH